MSRWTKFVRTAPEDRQLFWSAQWNKPRPWIAAIHRKLESRWRRRLGPGMHRQRDGIWIVNR